MRAWIACYAAGVACLAPYAAAQADGEAWQPIDRVTFEARLGSCPAGIQAVVSASRQAHADEEHYAEHGTWIRRSSVGWGNGITGATHTESHLVELPSCFEVRVFESLVNSSLFEVALSLSESGAHAPRAWAELALGFPLEALSSDDPRHGLPRLLIDLRRRQRTENMELQGCRSPVDSGQPSVSEPLMPPQPWYPGRPMAAPAVWSEGYVTYASGEPRRARRGPEGEVWEIALPSRYGATAIAQYVPALDRHRWLGVTRECVVGTIDWLGVRRGWLVAVVDGPSGNFTPELMLVHLARGTVHRLWWPFLGNDDGLPSTEGLCNRHEPDRDRETCLHVSLRGGRLRAALSGSSGTLDIDGLLERADPGATAARSARSEHDE